MLLRRRTLSILALALAVVTLAVSPRALHARPAPLSRSPGSKRAHGPRHILPQGAYEISRRSAETRRTRAEFERLTSEARLESSTMLQDSSLPDHAAVELAKPRYLRLFEDPQRGPSPPA